MVEKPLLVVRHEIEVVKRLEGVNILGCWLWLRIVIYKPTRDVRVEALRYGIEEILR